MAAEQVTAPGLNYYRDEHKRHRRAASLGGSARPACDYRKRQRGDGSGKAIA